MTEDEIRERYENAPLPEQYRWANPKNLGEHFGTVMASRMRCRIPGLRRYIEVALTEVESPIYWAMIGHCENINHALYLHYLKRK